MPYRVGMDQKQALFIYTALLKVGDGLAVLLAWMICWWLRFDLAIVPTIHEAPSFSVYLEAALPLALILSVVMHLIGAYRPNRIHFGFRALKKLLHGSILGTLVFVSFAYFQGSILYSRVYLALFAGVSFLVLIVFRLFAETIWRSLQSKVRGLRTLLIGNGKLLSLWVSKVQNKVPSGYSIVGRLGEPAQSPEMERISYLGNESELSNVLEEKNIEQVVLSYSNDSPKLYTPILERLSHELVNVKLIPDYGSFSTFTYMTTEEEGLPLLLFNQPPAGTSDRVIKRLVDFLLALFVLIGFFPLYVVIALLVKLSSPGPVFYSQRRVGADGKLFTCYKFRSMRVGAETETGPVWAQKGDARVTPVGRWLRKTSLDELPQFYNILLGNMSVVGPRPERPEFVKQFKGEVPKYMLRHQMKSGITGWAQVNGFRGNTSLEKRIQHDLYYIGHWSHLFDIKIITVTPWILIKGFFKGYAY